MNHIKTHCRLSYVLLIILAVFLTGAVQAKTLKISHVRPKDTAIYKDLRWFSDTLAKTSGGKMKTKIW
jgi:TRAP-type C4-dicarboxylate transport system substrate-binding protein